MVAMSFRVCYAVASALGSRGHVDGSGTHIIRSLKARVNGKELLETESFRGRGQGQG